MATSMQMMRGRQVAYTIVVVIILGYQSIGNFASRPLLQERGRVFEKLSHTDSDNVAESARKFERFLSEQPTKQMTPVVLDHKDNDEQHHDHGRMLSGRPPNTPPIRTPPKNEVGEAPPPESPDPAPPAPRAVLI